MNIFSIIIAITISVIVSVFLTKAYLASEVDELDEWIPRQIKKESDTLRNSWNKDMRAIFAIMGKEMAVDIDDENSFIITDKKTGKKQICFLDYRGKDGLIDLVEKKEKKGYVSTGRFIDGKEYMYKTPKSQPYPAGSPSSLARMMSEDCC